MSHVSRLLLVSLLFGAAVQPAAQATQIPWCLRVVPSGALVFWYGESQCK